MKNLMTICLVLLVSLTAFGCTSEENSTKLRMQDLYRENKEITVEYDESLAVKCNNGTFVGKEESGVLAFKGVPYAEQPVDELRWKIAEPAADNDGVYEAYYYGKSPIQSEWASEVGSYYEQGEDCLDLNIWTNTKNTSANKTVMVFFHGGSYGWGGTSDPLYDGHNLVEKYDDIILVTVGYRTGIMGFIDFSSVEGGEEYQESGNLGLLDQVEALRWIQKNISAFGGDPNNVTIFGESAGGGSVSLLPLIAGTDGLFNRVIAESGSVALTYSTEECQNLTQMLLEETGCTTVSELVTLSQETLMEVNELLNDYNNFPERDGVVLPKDLYAAYEEGVTADLDMLMGTNADETRYWINEMGYYTDLVSGQLIYSVALPVMYENNITKISDEDMQYVDSFMELQSDKKVWNLTEFYNEILFRVPALAQAESHSENGGSAYVYHWTYPGEDENIGACHAIELSYVFNNLQETIYTGNHVSEELAETVQDMWVNFARCGNPSTEDISWEAYNSDTKITMVLDEEVQAVSDYKSEQRELIEPLLKYGCNGCYSQLSYNVPQVYKLVGATAIVLVLLAAAVVVIVRKVRRKR